MADFLLELRGEEIPARMQAGARAELEKLFRRELEAAGVKHDNLRIWSTPRRLALIAYDLPAATEAVSEEAKGPPEGAPDAAIDGFCKKAGVTRDQLELRDVKGRMTYFAVVNTPGRPIVEVLSERIPAIVYGFSWPKSMRWGEESISTESLRWVRPLSGMVALLDDQPLSISLDGVNVYQDKKNELHFRPMKTGIVSSNRTFGHRFHSSGEIIVQSVDTYADQLRAAHVIVNHEERQDIIRQGAAEAAAAAGLTLIDDEGLVVENAGLTEYPVPLLGRFDEAFLDVPPEVIQLTARVNQKYFVCEGEGGKLANAFVCTANIDPIDPAVVVDGNRKVLAARLSDARFFWEQDQKTPLAEHAKKLARITFHEKLGTVADKVERVAKLARWLCEEGIILPGTGRGTADAVGGGGDSPLGVALGGESPPSAAAPLPPPRPGEERARLADLAEQAARLCKADLVTEMVGEFPELQGLMGGYYAAKEGLPQEVAEAIRDHYKPVGQGDDVPTAPVTVAVSLADKLDTLAGFFFHGLQPTGSKDPFALRRAALSCGALLATNDLRIDFRALVIVALNQISEFVLDSEIARSKSAAEREYHWHAKQGAGALKFTQEGEFRAFIGRNGEEYQFSQSDYYAYESLRKSIEQKAKDRYDKLGDYVEFRFNNLLQESGIDVGLVSAVEANAKFFGVRRRLAFALQTFVDTEDGTNLLAGYKRAANILKRENYPPRHGEGDRPQGGGGDSAASDGVGGKSPPSPASPLPPPRAGEDRELSYTPEPAEKALIDALDAAAPRAAAAVEAEKFADAMAALATLRAPIDRFFEEVTVNDADAEKRAARLALLARFRDAVHRVADFSRIEG